MAMSRGGPSNLFSGLGEFGDFPALDDENVRKPVKKHPLRHGEFFRSSPGKPAFRPPGIISGDEIRRGRRNNR